MLRTHHSIPLLLLVACCSGCALFGKAEKEARPTTPYQPLVNALDEEYLHSPAGDVAVRYPNGWLHVDISTIPMQNVLEVYTDPERARALVLAELPATAELRRSVERDGMAALVNQSYQMKSAKLSGRLEITRPAEIYTVNGKLFVSYEYGLDWDNTREIQKPEIKDSNGLGSKPYTVLIGSSGYRVYDSAELGPHSHFHRKENRVALFTTGAKFYELALIELTAPTRPSDHILNFRLLESVVASVEGAAEVNEKEER